MTEFQISYDAGDAASAALAAADPKLGRLVDDVGCIRLTGHDSPFQFIAHSIVSQQLSGKVAQTIWARLVGRVGDSPVALTSASQDELLAVGLSHRKAEYLQGVARAALAGDIDLDSMDALTDDEVVERLTALRGVGPWTAHMFLIFALRRPDVIADGDQGVRVSVGKLMGLGRPATSAEVVARAERWRPYRSVALFYLWAATDSGAFLRCDMEIEG
jgi:DNA-3-methyladenine glycosylase II